MEYITLLIFLFFVTAGLPFVSIFGAAILIIIIHTINAQVKAGKDATQLIDPDDAPKMTNLIIPKPGLAKAMGIALGTVVVFALVCTGLILLTERNMFYGMLDVDETFMFLILFMVPLFFSFVAQIALLHFSLPTNLTKSAKIAGIFHVVNIAIAGFYGIALKTLGNL